MRIVLLVLATLAVAAGASPLASQDVDALARLRGIAAPAAYYERLRSDPTAYQFERALLRRAPSAVPGGGPARTGVAGSLRLPVVLALFSDSPTPHISRDMVQAALFDGPAARGTLTEAYLEMSRGALTVGGDVLGWVRTSETRASVLGASQGLGNDGTMGAYFREALDSLDGSVDFSVYDNDGPDGVPDSGDDDGYVDVITFEFLEVEASCGGPGIWPHRWTLSGRLGRAYRTDDLSASGDTILVDDYITQGVTQCSGTEVQDASTMAHELGHAFGLPDYYHWIDFSAGARGRRWVLGCWDLMAAGSWGCGPVDEPRGAFGPTHFSAHSKHRLGWVDYEEIGEVWNAEIFLDPVQSSGRAVRIAMDGAGQEYLIAEYRTRTGFDAELPAGGVLFYQQDLDARYFPDPSSGDPYFLALLEQDDNDGLVRTDLQGGNRGEAGDVWGIAGAPQELHYLTAPSLRSSAGGSTSVTVHEVSVMGGQARLVVSTASSPRLVVPTGAPVLPTSLRIAGGVMPYEVSWSGPVGVSVAVDGDDLVLAGAPANGSLELAVSVRDAAGAQTDPLVGSEGAWATWAPRLDELLAPILDVGGGQLGAAQSGWVDQIGNANGVYDVGDVRRWLRERGGTP